MAQRPIKTYEDISGTCSSGSEITESYCLCGAGGVWNGSTCTSGSATGYTWTLTNPDRIISSQNLFADMQNDHGICSGTGKSQNACLCDTSAGSGDGVWSGSECTKGSATGYTWTVTIKEITEAVFKTRQNAYDQKIMAQTIFPEEISALTPDGDLSYLYVHAGSCSGNDTTSTTKNDCEDSGKGGGAGTWTAGTSFKENVTGRVIDITLRDDLTDEDEDKITKLKNAINNSYIEAFPPVTTFYCKTFDIWFIADGLHRIYASYDLTEDIPYINVDVDMKIRVTDRFVHLYKDELEAISEGFLGECAGESGGTPYSDNKADCEDSGINGSAGTWTAGTTTMTSAMYLKLVAERNSWYKDSTAGNPAPPEYSGGGSAA